MDEVTGVTSRLDLGFGGIQSQDNISNRAGEVQPDELVELSNNGRSGNDQPREQELNEITISSNSEGPPRTQRRQALPNEDDDNFPVKDITMLEPSLAVLEASGKTSIDEDILEEFEKQKEAGFVHLDGEEEDRFLDESDNYENSRSSRIRENSSIEKTSVGELRMKRASLKDLTPQQQEYHVGKMLNTRMGIDWAEENEDHCVQGAFMDRIKLTYHIDYTSADAAPFKALTGPEATSQNVNVRITFAAWNQAYQSVRGRCINFSVYERCFAFGKIGEVKVFLVMQPRSGDIANSANYDVTPAKASSQAALIPAHARQLFAYLLDVALSVPCVSRRGFTEEMKLWGKEEVSLDLADWKAYQEAIMVRWPTFVTSNPESFWTDHIPTIHAYHYGQDTTFLRSELQTGKMADDMSELYNPETIQDFTFALATMVEYSTINPTHVNNAFMSEKPPQQGEPFLETMGVAFDTRNITAEYDNPRASKLRIFPVGFSPTVCSFQANCAPLSYRRFVLDPLNRKLAEENGLSPHQTVVKDGIFQGYLGITAHIRKRQWTFEIGKGKNVASLCSPKEMSAAHTTKRKGFISEVTENKPFTVFDKALKRARKNHRVGVRIEPVISIEIPLLKAENRTWDYICTNIIHPLTYWFKGGRAILDRWTRMYYTDVFPQVLHEFSWIFMVSLRSMRRQWSLNRRQLGLVGSEAVSTLERLAAYMFTGNKAHIPKTLWNYLQLYESLESFGWPFIDPQRIDLTSIPSPSAKSEWLQAGDDDFTLVLTHLKGLSFHFGHETASRRALQMSLLSSNSIDGPTGAATRVRQILATMFIPEMVEVTCFGLKNTHTTLTTTQWTAIKDPNNEAEVDSVEALIPAREMAMYRWKEEVNPFELETMDRIITMFYRSTVLGAKITEFPRSAIPFLKPNEFAGLIMQWAKEDSIKNGTTAAGKPKASFSRPSHAWLPALLGLVDPGSSDISADVWALAISSGLRDLRIDIIPGPYNQKLSSVRFTRLQDYISTSEKPVVLDANFNSSTSAYALLKVQSSIRKMPFPFPFPTLPPLLTEGYRKVMDNLRNKEDNVSSGLTSLDLQLFFGASYALLDLSSHAHQYIMIVGWCLSALPSPPVGTRWFGDSRDYKLSPGSKSCAHRGSWYFLFVARCLLHTEPSLAHHNLKLIIKVIEHRKINSRLIEALRIVVRKPGCRRPHAWIDDLDSNTRRFFIEEVERVEECWGQGLKSVLSLWLSDNMLSLAFASIVAD